MYMMMIYMKNEYGDENIKLYKHNNRNHAKNLNPNIE